ncbi:hypothetical protein [Streptomyces sviceus]|uniref:hypothetical protein n=1 Tax=Streptomyces sviceus TaxID=285530 RepID=UPI0036A91B6A
MTGVVVSPWLEPALPAVTAAAPADDGIAWFVGVGRHAYLLRHGYAGVGALAVPGLLAGLWLAFSNLSLVTSGSTGACIVLGIIPAAVPPLSVAPCGLGGPIRHVEGAATRGMSAPCVAG